MKTDAGLERRHRVGRLAKVIFLMALGFAILSLATLLVSILDGTAGYVLTAYRVDPAGLLEPNEDLDGLSRERLIVLIRDNLRSRRVRALDAEKPLDQREAANLHQIFTEEVLELEVLKAWRFLPSAFAKGSILKEAERVSAEEAEGRQTRLSFRFWLQGDFLTGSQSADALSTGVRSALLGSFFTIILTILFAFPLGIGAAIWLEEYAKDNGLTRFIQTNIYNLAGVPSIIYGMLGLAIFVRGLAPLTSGSMFGGTAAQVGGRSILSASLTLAILILPILIINAQEAIRAVPRGLREASYALGASRWKTISAHVLPASMDRVLTGTVIAISRALGETAPLVLVGAAAYLTSDPDSIFSRFTTLPIQIYQYTARPQPEFRNVAAAAIVVLMVLLLSLNAGAILLREHYRKAKR